MEVFFGNIGYAITGLSILTIMACIFSRVDGGFAIGLALGAYTAAAWIPPLWQNPSEMANIHTIIVMFAFAAVHGRHSNKIVTLLVVALAADVFWSYLRLNHVGTLLTNLFFWQSLLNLLTILLCVTVLIKCYNRPTKNIGDHEEGLFHAKIATRNVR